MMNTETADKITDIGLAMADAINPIRFLYASLCKIQEDGFALDGYGEEEMRGMTHIIAEALERFDAARGQLYGIAEKLRAA